MNMSHRYRPATLFAVLVHLFAVLPVMAQPKEEPKKLPPINPPQARLEQTFKGLDGPGFAIVARDDGGLVAAACDGSTIQLWSKDVLLGIRSGDATANILKGHQGTVTDLAWNGGPILASTGADKKILLWSMNESKVVNTLDNKYVVRNLAMSPDGKLLAAGGDDVNILIWDIASAKMVKELKGHTDWVTCLAFSEDSKLLASGSYEGKALLWDVNSGNKVRDLVVPPAAKPKEPPVGPVVITQVAFDHEGKQIAVGKSTGEIDQVNPADGKLIRTIKGHTSTITGLAFHPTGTLLVSSSKDGSIRLWNPPNGGAVKTLEDHKAWVQDVTFLAEGTRLASVGADRTVRVWNLTSP
jgi:WD40 repeat protein